MLAKTNSGAAKLATVDDTTPRDSFTGGKSSWQRGQRARLDRERDHKPVRDRGRERDRPAPVVAATTEQTSTTTLGQFRRKLESRSQRAGGTSGQARLAEAVLLRVERVVAQSQPDREPGSRAQGQRLRLHRRRALRKAVL